jgi:hypothetical protein
MNNIRQATSRTFKNKKKYLKDKINEPELKQTVGTKILKDLYRGINKSKWSNMKPNTAIYLTFQKLFRINTC